MRCKSCQGEMVCQPRMDLTYYECRDCGSVWFSGGELENLLEHKLRIDFPKLPGETAGGAEADAGMCPACGTGSSLLPKTTFATPRVSILGCPTCYGHWLTRQQARDLVSIVCYPPPIGLVRRVFARLAGS